MTADSVTEVEVGMRDAICREICCAVKGFEVLQMRMELIEGWYD